MPRRRDAPFEVLGDLSFQIGEPKFELESIPRGEVVRVVPVLATDCMEGAVHSESAERLRSLPAPNPVPVDFTGQYHFRTRTSMPRSVPTFCRN